MYCSCVMFTVLLDLVSTQLQLTNTSYHIIRVEVHIWLWIALYKYSPFTYINIYISSQYIFSISIFVIKNKHLCNTNNQIHGVHTRFKTNLHPPIANLTKFQRRVYYSGIKIFNDLPHDTKDLANKIILFWNDLKRFLLINSFYNSEEYFNYQR
jgi:hypothetical protein